MMAAIALKKRFRRLEEIGKGSFGKVYRGIDTQDGKVVAIKTCRPEDDADMEEILLEVQSLSDCDSKFITELYAHYVEKGVLHMIMEYCDGGSGHELISGVPLPEDAIAIITREMLLGLEYLHDQNKIHRDIKSANVLFTKQGDVKLADLGVAGQLAHTMAKRNTFVGTPFWMAPEVIKQNNYNTKADVWSVGITVLEMAWGHPPHHELNPMKALLVISREPAPRLEDDGMYSEEMRDFVEGCLVKSDAKRPDVKRLLRHPFITSAGRNSEIAPLIEEVQLFWAEEKKREEEEQNRDRKDAAQSLRDTLVANRGSTFLANGSDTFNLNNFRDRYGTVGAGGGGTMGKIRDQSDDDADGPAPAFTPRAAAGSEVEDPCNLPVNIQTAFGQLNNENPDLPLLIAQVKNALQNLEDEQSGAAAEFCTNAFDRMFVPSSPTFQH